MLGSTGAWSTPQWRSPAGRTGFRGRGRTAAHGTPVRPPEGLVAYTRAVAQATELLLIAYQRGNAVFDPETAAELARMP